jgi:hypothetical protein
VCLLLLPRFAGAAGAAIDLDGDGRHDSVVFDDHAPAIVRVWLSASDTTQVIHSRVPLLRVVAMDLDGDARPELIARDRTSQIHVWTWQRERFHRYRPRQFTPPTLTAASRRSVEDDDPDEESITTASTLTPFERTLCASPGAPDLTAVNACAADTACAYRSCAAADLFPPRPPPARASL